MAERFRTEFPAFVSRCAAVYRTYMAENLPFEPVCTFLGTVKSKQAFIYRVFPDGRRVVHCRVDKRRGKIYRNRYHVARGSIFDKDEGMSYMGPFGPTPLKQEIDDDV